MSCGACKLAHARSCAELSRGRELRFSFCSDKWIPLPKYEKENVHLQSARTLPYVSPCAFARKSFKVAPSVIFETFFFPLSIGLDVSSGRRSGSGACS